VNLLYRANKPLAPLFFTMKQIRVCGTVPQTPLLGLSYRATNSLFALCVQLQLVFRTVGLIPGNYLLHATDPTPVEKMRKFLGARVFFGTPRPIFSRGKFSGALITQVAKRDSEPGPRNFAGDGLRLLETHYVLEPASASPAALRMRQSDLAGREFGSERRTCAQSGSNRGS
jgi:hypothetical protein